MRIEAATRYTSLTPGFESPPTHSQKLNAVGIRLVTGSADWRARVWKTNGGKKPLNSLIDDEGPFKTAVFSMDGKRIMSTS